MSELPSAEDLDGGLERVAEWLDRQRQTVLELAAALPADRDARRIILHEVAGVVEQAEAKVRQAASVLQRGEYDGGRTGPLPAREPPIHVDAPQVGHQGPASQPLRTAPMPSDSSEEATSSAI